MIALLLFPTFLAATTLWAEEQPTISAKQLKLDYERQCLVVNTASEVFTEIKDGLCTCKHLGKTVYSDEIWFRIWDQPSLNSCVISKNLHDQFPEALAKYRPYVEEKDGRLFCGFNGTYITPSNYRVNDADPEEFNIKSSLTQEKIAKCRADYQKYTSLSSFELVELFRYFTKNLPQNAKSIFNANSESDMRALADFRLGARSVRIIAKLKGRHGGTIYVYRHLKNKPWFDGSDQPDVQLDPRFGYFGIGKGIAEYFGYYRYDDETYGLPDLHEFLGASEDLRIASGKNVLGGIPYSAIGAVSSSDYLKYFRDKGGLPISSPTTDSDETFYFHDIALHVPWFVVATPKLSEKLRSFAGITLDFLEYVKRFHGETLKIPQARERVEMVKKRVTHLIDQTTAVSIFFAMRALDYSGTQTESDLEQVLLEEFNQELCSDENQETIDTWLRLVNPQNPHAKERKELSKKIEKFAHILHTLESEFSFDLHKKFIDGLRSRKNPDLTHEEEIFLKTLAKENHARYFTKGCLESSSIVADFKAQAERVREAIAKDRRWQSSTEKILKSTTLP